MTARKILLDQNVYQAAIERLEWIFDTFGKVCVSFSGGKDSSSMLHLAAEVARKKKVKFSILFIDWEVQFSYTIDFVDKMRKEYLDCTDKFYWVALPLTTVSGISQIKPEWTCWDSELEWVREKPVFAITEYDYFPFYTENMTFEAFVEGFGDWFAQGTSAVSLIGIRSDESINRFNTIASTRKMRYSDDTPWTTASLSGFHYKAYPIYDWKVSDIWHFFSKFDLKYNTLYDLMFQAGVPLGSMRICEPFGPEQRKGLWLYKIIEPDMWSKICSRVSGAVSGSLYGNRSGDFFAKNKINKPDDFTWKEYALFLLSSMPPKTAEHYKNKIAIYLKWYKDRDYPNDIPDFQENDCGGRDIPSWRRICKVILKNDYWCKMLSFSPNKTRNYNKYFERVVALRKGWGII
ncbi:phosphoadenosine phosphosulfate reductase [Plesiomonas shigelloides]|uniref:phosphoadenosine phosphosulfate reductase n=1 Tax=Plesiomonas shigelloides TaxID=703 RepID=UPI00057ABF7A|nr:DUF3440 domain-containing protein [Plesiomonas shigelloides]